MVEAVVEFDYTADAEDELTLQVGEVIANIKIMDGGWWEGELRGKRGMFPDNFVKLTKEQTPPPTKVANERTHLTIEEEEKNKVNKPVTKRGGADKIRSLRAKACYSYTPQNDDELGLKIGDTIEVINQEEPGWWEGTINGRVGVFPSNFVEVVEEDEDEKAKAELKEPKQPPPPPPSQTSEGDTKPKKAMGMGFGDIFKNGQPKLRKTGSTLERGTQPPRVLPTSSSPTEEKTTPIETTKV
uniref:SH3 domain-containing kinase-binding protein 1-like n=1 Tax=Saccoglossus kowalevskii TaxID=10224 RepID=A0ABM0N164_SACKO